jgi:hypothetical protein
VIKTNEGPPDKNVRISAEVVTRPDSTYPIVIKPYKLDLTQFGEKVRSEIKFTIVNVSDKPLHPNLVCSAYDLFDVTLPKAIPAGKTGEGILRLKKTAVDKAFEKCLTLQLDDEKTSRFTIPVKRTIRGASASLTPTPVGTPTSGH